MSQASISPGENADRFDTEDHPVDLCTNITFIVITLLENAVERRIFVTLDIGRIYSLWKNQKSSSYLRSLLYSKVILPLNRRCVPVFFKGCTRIIKGAVNGWRLTAAFFDWRNFPTRRMKILFDGLCGAGIAKERHRPFFLMIQHLPFMALAMLYHQ